tara:strand:- start:428 stop:2065 length:1638 start_codon:yes stop_codon:yes gene_type:complete
MGATVKSWDTSTATQAQGGTSQDLIRVLRGIVNSRYDVKATVFDKGRGWAAPEVLETMKKVQGDVKVVATVRPVADCLASLVKIVNFPDVREFFRNSDEALHFFRAYQVLSEGYAKYPDNFLLIEYDELVRDPQAQLDSVAEFVGLDFFKHDKDHVPTTIEEDNIWGIKDLHKVRSKVSKRKYSAKEVLGAELYAYYQGGEFWNDSPEPLRATNDPLDLQLEASLQGKFEKSARLSAKLLIDRPSCNRVKFNAGWHELQKGNLLEGHKLLNYGRLEGVFGSEPETSQPLWNGEEGGTVLMQMESGLGDQIKSLRYAFEIQKTNKVVLSCSPELAPIFAESFISSEHGAGQGIYHDYYVPSMSAVIPLNLEMKDISGKPYIRRTAEAIPGRVGVRWQGNPDFDHDTHRKFPATLMFDAVRDLNCVSLQRDTDDVPTWMKKVDLSTWMSTRHEISKCELVITSCTSVAHMSAALGVPTWIVVPILPYYLWAMPGDKSLFYDSVTLFRQEKYGDWYAPFEQIKSRLLGIHNYPVKDLWEANKCLGLVA